MVIGDKDNQGRNGGYDDSAVTEIVAKSTCNYISKSTYMCKHSGIHTHVHIHTNSCTWLYNI